jgi:PPP family 3-phenylpropionic acid transporter
MGGDALKLGIFFAAAFFPIGIYTAYLPVWLKWRGLSEPQITMVYALPLIMRIVFTPAMTYFADKSGTRRALVYWLSHGCLATLLVLPFAPSVPAIFAVLTLYALLWTSIVPLTEALAVEAVKREGSAYGAMRLWGSLSFIAAVICGGVIVEAGGPTAALWLMIAASTTVALAALNLPGSRTAPAPVPEAGQAINFRDAGRLARSPCFLLFLVSAAAVTASHAVYNTLITLHWLSLGIDASVIGVLWATGVVAEIALFGYSGRIVARFGATPLMIAGAAAALLRWVVMAFDPPLAVLFPVQMLHSLTYGAAHLGAIQFLSRAVPERFAATGQGLYAAVAAGIGAGFASLAAGPLYKSVQAGAFLVMALLALLSLIFAIWLALRWSGDVLTGDGHGQSHQPDGGGNGSDHPHRSGLGGPILPPT